MKGDPTKLSRQLGALALAGEGGDSEENRVNSPSPPVVPAASSAVPSSYIYAAIDVTPEASGTFLVGGTFSFGGSVAADVSGGVASDEGITGTPTGGTTVGKFSYASTAATQLTLVGGGSQVLWSDAEVSIAAGDLINALTLSAMVQLTKGVRANILFVLTASAGTITPIAMNMYCVELP